MALIGTALLLNDSTSQIESRELTLKQIAANNVQLEKLRSQHTSEPSASAIAALRQRIAALNALDFGAAPSVTRVLAVLEQLTPPAVALQNLDYDRGRIALELVAVSESSDALTVFFDIASRSGFFKSVRLIDKKQAGATAGSAPLYQVRLSIRPAGEQPRS